MALHVCTPKLYKKTNQKKKKKNQGQKAFGEIPLSASFPCPKKKMQKDTDQNLYLWRDAIFRISLVLPENLHASS